MSHFACIKAEITDLSVMKSVVESMGFEMVQNGACRYYGGTQVKDWVIKLPGQYDAALELKTREDGTQYYQLTADWYGGHVAKYIGQGGSELIRRYAIEKIKKEARARGFMVSQKTKGDNIIITARDGKGASIEFTCDPEGHVSSVVKGVAGRSCMKLIDLEKAVGTIESIKKTSQFYETEKQERGLERIYAGRDNPCG